MYYDIVNSGERIKELRAARRMTRQQLAEQIGLSVDALRKIEDGVNGILIRDYSRERMVNECKKMMREYEYRKKIGENGRKSVNKYSCECVEKQWFDFIDNI